MPGPDFLGGACCIIAGCGLLDPNQPEPYIMHQLLLFSLFFTPPPLIRIREYSPRFSWGAP